LRTIQNVNIKLVDERGERRKERPSGLATLKPHKRSDLITS
jgi:hypothetical protein